jgi:hypothetical protein
LFDFCTEPEVSGRYGEDQGVCPGHVVFTRRYVALVDGLFGWRVTQPAEADVSSALHGTEAKRESMLFTVGVAGVEDYENVHGLLLECMSTLYIFESYLDVEISYVVTMRRYGETGNN